MELLPRFREIDLFAITISLILVFLAYNAQVLDFIWHMPGMGPDYEIRCLAVGGVALLIFVYAQFLSVKYALEKGVPDDVDATLMVLVALATLIPFSLAGALQVYIEFLRSSSAVDLLPIVFPLLALSRSAVAFSMFPAINNHDYVKLFDYNKDTAGAEVPAAVIAAACTMLAVRFFTDYSFLLALLIIYDVSVMAANMASKK